MSIAKTFDSSTWRRISEELGCERLNQSKVSAVYWINRLASLDQHRSDNFWWKELKLRKSLNPILLEIVEQLI